jgi:3-methyladenine DNA glycosylase AlkD
LGVVAVDWELVKAVREGLAEAADPVKAPAMQAYMKSVMPFHGVPAPAARRVFTAALTAHPLPDRQAWQDTVRAMWDDATHREERYAALALAGHRGYRAHQDPQALPLYRHLVVTGAWWDHVDNLAADKVGPILRSHPAEVRPVVLAWSTDPDMWLRRTAILCQLGAKEATDRELLAACLGPNLADRAFFIRKAIGWALRELAKTDPGWVRAYVDEHVDDLSPLSRREALKNLAPG